MINRDEAFELFDEYLKDDKIIKHSLAVEAIMIKMARKLDGNETLWGLTGLLHDLDWEKYPDTHPNTSVPIFEESGYDKDFINAILGHAFPERTDVPRESKMAKYLFACDEVTGFVFAYSLMKPGGLDEVKSKSVKKKMKDKAFARNVNRDDILLGAEEIGLELTEHLDNIIEAMKNDERLKS